jgi:hypothetical protein
MNKVHRKFWSKNDPGKTPRVGETCSSERAASFIKFQASGNYICSRKLNTQQRQLISLFPRQSFLEIVPTTSSNSEPNKLRIFVCCTTTTLYGPRFLCRLYGSVQTVWIQLMLYDCLDFCAEFTSISVHKTVLYGLVMAVINCWYLPRFLCPPLHGNSCHSFLEMIFFLLFFNLLSLQRMLVCVLSMDS